MPDLIGFTAIALVSLITLILSLKYPEISRILLVALTFRILIYLVFVSNTIFHKQQWQK